MSSFDANNATVEHFVPGNMVETHGEAYLNAYSRYMEMVTGRELELEYLVGSDLFRLFSTLEGVVSGMIGGQKKIPRPMNCFMLFRDHEYHRLKAQNPDVNIRDVSKKCSALWKEDGEVLQAFWKEEARKVKEEHERLYPDYKYTPRRPGEIKKRQRPNVNKNTTGNVQDSATETANAGENVETNDINDTAHQVHDADMNDDVHMEEYEYDGDEVVDFGDFVNWEGDDAQNI